MKNNKVYKDINRYPFIIGVTGHRDIAACDIPALRAYIDEQFKAIKSACDGAQVALKTCLAEGADQLCAEIAIENDIPIISILPLEKSELEKDFVDDTLIKFNELYEKSVKSFVTLDMEGRGENDTNYWYRQAGIYIAERCQLLLALWDGNEDTTGCGTAAIIKYSSREWSHNDRGFAYNPMIEWIHVRRSTDTTDNSEPIKIISENIGIHQEDAIKYAKIYSNRVHDLNACEGKSDDLANELAVEYREKNSISSRVTAATSIATVLFFMLYDEFYIKPALFVVLFFVVITVVMKYIAKKHDYLGKQVGYRLLAETNRVQEFTTSLKKSYSVCDFYTYFIKDSYGWIEQAARAHLVSNDGDKFIDEDAVRDNWCQGQYIYHSNSRKRDLPKLRRQQAATELVIGITVAVYISLAVIELTIGSSLDIIRSMKVLMAVGSAVSLFVSDYYERQALEHNCQDSAKMAELYHKAYDEWCLRDKTGESKDSLIEILARAEIEEIGIWASYQR